MATVEEELLRRRMEEERRAGMTRTAATVPSAGQTTEPAIAVPAPTPSNPSWNPNPPATTDPGVGHPNADAMAAAFAAANAQPTNPVPDARGSAPYLGAPLERAIDVAQNPDQVLGPVVNGPGGVASDIRNAPVVNTLPHGTPIGGGAPIVGPGVVAGPGGGGGGVGVVGGGGVGTPYGGAGGPGRSSRALYQRLNTLQASAGDRAQDAMALQGDELQAYQDAIAGRPAVTAGDAALVGAEQEQLRTAQLGLVGALQQQSQGVDPLVAEMTREARARNIADAASMAASARGRVNPALLARQQANQAVQANQQTQRDAFLAALQQRDTSQGRLADVLGSARGQDIDVGAFDADARNRRTEFGTGIEIDQQRYGDQMGIDLTNQRGDLGLKSYDLASNVYNTQFGRQRQLTGEDIQRLGIHSGVGINAANIANQQQIARDDRRHNLYGAGINAVGQGLGALLLKSDATQKTDVEGADSAIDSFLGGLKSYSYKYKDPKSDGAAEGQRFGVMAQDVASSDVGSSFVRHDADGMKLDPVQGFGPVLASLGRLQRRSEQLESELKGLRKRGRAN